ncbi:hypothetical protein ATY81_17370 [Rhizobium sp. R72]|uniref:hypothetical protein n=1 Tax=unclassified Rhizobium TaxID=2613769 RepID=UPI000B52CEEE|nr:MULTISPECIES: hypothetical protein [unclassified Rhizobium]OWW04095.1 hypothetical protein ATY81_17370 [Rhizobium sp. R72]OWW04298.1 hypothetical protein ATY80_17370 [Rhizobium sp. R711]
MASIPDLDTEVDHTKAHPMRLAGEQTRSRNAPFIALVLLLLPINAGILIYTAKNSADVRESREAIDALKRSIDGLKVQVDRQVGKARADEAAIIRENMESLQKTISALDERMRSSQMNMRVGAGLVLSAPGKEPTQYFAPSPPAQPVGNVPPDGSLASIDTTGGAVDNLPRYERTVSPEGKLILRKVP